MIRSKAQAADMRKRGVDTGIRPGTARLQAEPGLSTNVSRLPANSTNPRLTFR